LAPTATITALRDSAASPSLDDIVPNGVLSFADGGKDDLEKLKVVSQGGTFVSTLAQGSKLVYNDANDKDSCKVSMAFVRVSHFLVHC
jgi:hypothetical protein